ncbi:MAG: class I SAM-dependent methyltransferase, partial [Flavobacteriaceae bacterium]
LLWKEKLLCKLLPDRGAILDIGAGTGDFVAALHKKDWEAYGVEPNRGALKRAGDKGIQLFPSLKELPVQKYKAITLWHVLEHLPDLESQIEGMKGLLDTDGFMIVAVPNYKSFDAKYYGEYWAAYDVPRHLWHFSRTSVARLFDAHGMKIVDTRPMWFDSFYVSLLSEKYKRGKQGYWRPFWIGVQSNLSALRTGEYSSLIYIITENKGK